MSLLNQVLRDLDAQEAPAASPELKLADLPPQPAQAALPQDKAPDRVRMLIWGVVILAVAAWALVWLTPKPEAPVAPQPVAVTPVEAPMTAPAEADPPAPSTEGLVTADSPIAPDAELAPTPEPTVAVPIEVVPKASPAPLLAKPDSPLAAVPVNKPVPEVVVETPPAEPEPDYVPLRITPEEGGSEPVKQPVLPAPSKLEEARVAIDQGQMSLAEQKLRELLQITPNHRVAHELLVGVLLRGNRTADVLAQIASSREQIGMHPGLELIRARALIESGQAAPAEQVLRQLLLEHANALDAKRLLAGLLQQQQRSEEALPLYTQLAAAPQARAQDWLGLALSSESTDRAMALRAYQQALALPGLSAPAVAYIQQRIGQLQ